MQEQQDRLDQLALEEQEQKSRLGKLGGLADRGRLEQAKLSRVTEEVGASQVEQQVEHQHPPEGEADATHHAEEALTLSTNHEPSEEAARKRRGRITQVV